MTKEPPKDSFAKDGDNPGTDYRALYASEASSYDEIRFSSARGNASMQVKNETIVHAISSNKKPESSQKIIDVASGTGRIVKHLLDCGFEDITATDLTREMLRECQESLEDIDRKKVQFHVADMMALPFPDNSFDFATLGSFLYLIPSADYCTYTSDIYRVLRPGGRLICEVSNSWGVLSPRNALLVLKQKVLDRKEVKSYVNPVEARKLFGKFKMVDLIGVDYPFVFRNLKTHKKICRTLGSNLPTSMLGGKMTLVLEKEF